MPEMTREKLRIEKLCVSFKRLLLDFPVLSRADVNNSFPSCTEAELDEAVKFLVEAGFITITHGKRGGERYSRRLEASRG